ncbi:MAG: hypothetical protein KY475_22460 [Planctomycetes bacterium]|nr:hypothetical protein [Planctomycetota bacterium]
MNALPQDAWDRRLAAPMFAVTVVFLALLGAAAEWIRLQEGAALPAMLVWLLIGTYLLFVAEVVFHFLRRDPHCRARIWCCLLPPLRLCSRDHASQKTLWVPFRGWVAPQARLVAELERAFSVPMILIALMILPLLAVEQFWAGAMEQYGGLRVFIGVATCVIWLAFTLEFFVMIAVVEKKLDYCKRHWMDIVVICLPFVAFLRFLRVGQALRLHQVSKLSRAYRLRGVSMRLWRSILVLDLIARLVRVRPEKQLAKLQQVIEDKELELDLLRERVRQLETEIAAAQAKELSLSEAGE